MNIEQAKTIAIIDILDKLGFQPVKKTDHDYWYSSPLRNEKTPSFHVHTRKNVWYDFGEELGGDVIGFVCVYLRRQNVGHSVSDALRWLRNMNGLTPTIQPVDINEPRDEERKLQVMITRPLERLNLIHYLENERGIPLAIANLYLKEVQVKNKKTKKFFFGIGMQNEDLGYEVRTPLFKGTVGRKNITFIRGSQTKPPGIHIFEGFMDFLSIMTDRKGEPFTDDVIILNSISCLKLATPYIRDYGYTKAYTWMDNDEAGEKATKNLNDFFMTEKNLVHQTMNEFYRGHKDVNAWHMHKRSNSAMELHHG